MKARIDKYDLYERTVQAPEGTAEMVARDYSRLRGKPARRMREDFAGTAALAAAWCRRNPRNTAVAVDLDPVPLAYGERKHRPGIEKQLALVRGDVLREHGRGYDLVIAFNYSWLALRTRDQLRAYFSRVRAALAPDGIFELDLYGGKGAIEEGEETTKMRGWTYIWDQQSYDPTTGETRCAIHWKLRDGRTLRRSFTYHWRLWSLPELWDLFEDTGLKCLEVHNEDDSPVEGSYRRVKRVPNWDQWNVKVLAERR
ncbi:MAG TPA: class I SAM-dependent methyltransferase [bacterium]|nr:class I SAM-dependent methyltransferase [bacterium]